MDVLSGLKHLDDSVYITSKYTHNQLHISQIDYKDFHLVMYVDIWDVIRYIVIISSKDTLKLTRIIYKLFKIRNKIYKSAIFKTDMMNITFSIVKCKILSVV